MLTLSRGQRLGPYEIRTILGSGSMGEVYRARDTRMGRNVAIKVMGPPMLAKGAVALQRFELEARAAGQLNHQNLLTIHDFGEHQDSRYMVVEFLEGETLRDRLDLGPIPARKAVDFTIQICRGLSAAHEKGILHRDLKPDNIFITKDGRIKILDFGLAKLIEEEARSQILGAAGPLTAPGIVMGTARYMSPEQARDLPLDARSDLFSVGSLLYEMLCGKPAFKGLTPLEAMTNIAKHDPADLVYPGEQVQGLDLIVHHCLEKQPDARVQSARDLIFQLETVLSGGVAEAPPPPKTNPLIWVAVGLALLLVPTAAFLFGRRASAAVLPSFHKLTFRRGSVWAARFAPDGQTVVYSAAWDAEPLQLFSTRPESPESRALGIADAKILSVSSGGELAMLIGQPVGTLARVPLAGGAPREMLEGVLDADWAPDGASLAVVRTAAGKFRLEYPVGNVLFETGGWIGNPRVSRSGEQVAFIDHPIAGYTRGTVTVVDRLGRARPLGRAWLNARGLAWSPSQEEVWFTAGDLAGETAVHALDLKGRERLVVPSTGNLTLQDVAPGGQILLSQTALRLVLMTSVRGQPPRDLSWMDGSLFADLADDGRALLFLEVGVAQAAQKSASAIYLRKTDGSPAIKLGEGSVSRLSPDGRFVLSSPRSEFANDLVLLPTGSGEGQKINIGDVTLTGDPLFFPDGKRLLLRGRQGQGKDRLYLLEPGAAPRPLTPEGAGDSYLISPDGTRLVHGNSHGNLLLQSVSGGEPAKVAGALPGDSLAGWSDDGGSLFVLTQRPPQIQKLSLATGKREPVTALFEPDPAGAGSIMAAHVTPDGRSYAYNYDISLNELYLVDGVR